MNLRVHSALLVPLLTAAVLIGPARAQEAAGQWHGQLTSPDTGGALHIGVEIAKAADGTLSGFAVSPDQTAEKIPIEAIKVEAGELSFTSEAVMGRFRGSWDAAHAAWAGQWMQAGMALPLVLEKGPIAASPQ
jgi:hypothetical protein